MQLVAWADFAQYGRPGAFPTQPRLQLLLVDTSFDLSGPVDSRQVAKYISCILANMAASWSLRRLVLAPAWSLAR